MGLAAYGTPGTIQQLKDLLEDQLSPGRVPELLKELTGIPVIDKTSDRYYGPALGIQDALMRLPDPDGPAHLWRRATDLLSGSRKEQIRQPEDLDAHFAELEILIRRQLWGSSYELIDTMEKQMQRWNAAGLLLKDRETIAGKLGGSYREMVNYNALGCIYLSRGNFGKAQQAFDNALRNASAVAGAYPHGRRKIHINLAALYLESGETTRAEQHYRDALAMAGEHDDILDRMAATAVADYFSGVLTVQRYPSDFPTGVKVAYLPPDRELRIDIDLPLMTAIPELESAEYLVAKKELKYKKLAAAGRNELYQQVVAQMALRTLHCVFAADREGLILEAACNGYVDTVNAATGQDAHWCLVSVQVSHADFDPLDLARVDPMDCLTYLHAKVSKTLEKYQPVQPIIEYPWDDLHYAEELDAAAGLDSVQNLLDLDGYEFDPRLASRAVRAR